MYVNVQLEPGGPVIVQLRVGGGNHMEVQLKPGDLVIVQLKLGGGDHVGDVVDEKVVEDVALVVGECKVVVACNYCHPMN